ACPVCGARVESLPKTLRGQPLEKAKAALEKAEGAAAAADEALREAERARDAATSALEGAAREAKSLGQEVAKRLEDAEVLEEELAKAFAGRLPPDPAATLDGRIGKLEGLELAETSARESFREAEWAASTSERERDAMLAQVAEARARLEGVSVSGLLDRAKAAGGRDVALPALPAIAVAKKDAAAIAETAGELADGLERLANDLDDVAERRGAGEADLLAEAEEAVGGLIAKTGSLPELVKAVGDARLRAAGELATAERAAADMRTRLANASKLVEDIAAQRLRAGRFGALAAELRADRIIAFLQLEALQILAAAGSEHLSTLSAGRYRLAYDEDEFFVIDTWNGEERRSARTLSGGETFLASLGLALALSEQVQSLAVTERARLESLFLDEGFGTLDPETLEIVVDAIEQLGGDGRMVGVITHVQELAIRLPARIEVEKSPRGSRLAVVT
ncbi:MAG: hypothetical protein HYU54_10810, partial [Actinobacteria bacterium]|nr:hypothetical protein [Actinomycetota bacterium]